jgi:hypothetical protein
VRGVSGVRTRRVRQDDRTRERIRAAWLVNRLQGHVAGKVELTATQVRSAEILLRKCLPDLLAAQVIDQTVQKFVIVAPQASACCRSRTPQRPALRSPPEVA